jgi:hypothetical protein
VSKIQALSLDLIRTDGGTQMRAELTQEVYLDYRDKWLAGVEFDPVDVFHDGAAYWLADGFHRFYGAREAKRASLPCRIHQGTQRDAILFACGANAEHGLRRSREDKRNAITTLLEDSEWGQRSNNWIAEQCLVSDKTVESVRKEREASRSEIRTCSAKPEENSDSKPKTVKRVGRDGKVYEVAAKPKPATKPADPAPRLHADSFEPAEFTGEAKDAFGDGVAGDLKQVFELRAEFDEQLAKLASIKTWMTQRATHPGAAVLAEADQRIRADLTQVHEELKFAKPHCVCVYCKNKNPKVLDCNACKGKGWMTEQVYKAAPKGLKRESA